MIKYNNNIFYIIIFSKEFTLRVENIFKFDYVMSGVESSYEWILGWTCD